MNMTKPMKIIFSTVAVCIAIALSSVVTVNASDNDITFDTSREQHQDHKHREFKHQENRHNMKRMTKALSLSEEQLVQIKVIKTQSKEQRLILRVSMKEFRIAKRKLLQSKNFDEKAFNALHDTYQPTFTKLALNRARAKHAVFNVLTTEQQKKWLKIIEHKKDKVNVKKRYG